MARIRRVPAHETTPEIARTYDWVRQGLAQLTGREPERIIEPLEVYAHVPGLLQGIVALEGATAGLNRLDARLSHLAQLKAATLTSCEYCIDLGSEIARRSGLSDAQLRALPRYRESGLFNALELLVLDYAYLPRSTLRAHPYGRTRMAWGWCGSLHSHQMNSHSLHRAGVTAHGGQNMIQGMHTIIYPVGDIAKARALFRALLGIDPYADGPYYVGFRVGGQEIGLDPHGHRQGMTGYWHVSDIRAALQSLLDAGAQAIEDVKTVGPGRLIASVRDPDGNIIGLLQSS